MKVSVIIPTCNRPGLIGHCLLHVFNSAGEIIVSDDSTDDRTRFIVEQEFPSVRWISGPRRGPAANRNHAARAASGEWLAFIDDDCQPQPGWLAALTELCGDSDIVEGRTVAPGASDSPWEEHVENLHGGLFWSCNLAVRREAFDRLGGFDEDFLQPGGEDMEFAWRAARAGLRVRFAPGALVHHPPRRIGWQGLWRRTWMIRWMSLYRAKTGRRRAWFAAPWAEIALLLRSSAQLITQPDRHRPRRQLFAVAWQWLTFPLVFFYVLFWDSRYSRQFATEVSREIP